LGGKKSWKTFVNFENIIEKSFINWRVLPLVKISTHISDTPCIYFKENKNNNAKREKLKSLLPQL
jgi:hypothetical protein